MSLFEIKFSVLFSPMLSYVSYADSFIFYLFLSEIDSMAERDEIRCFISSVKTHSETRIKAVSCILKVPNELDEGRISGSKDDKINI
jgi:hypothetical protein